MLEVVDHCLSPRLFGGDFEPCQEIKLSLRESVMGIFVSLAESYVFQVLRRLAPNQQLERFKRDVEHPQRLPVAWAFNQDVWSSALAMNFSVGKRRAVAIIPTLPKLPKSSCHKWDIRGHSMSQLSLCGTISSNEK